MKMKTEQYQSYLNAVFKNVSWQQETFFLINWLAEDDELLKQEYPPLAGSRQEATFLFTDREGILLQQLPLSCDLSLKMCGCHKHCETQITPDVFNL